MRLPDRLRGRHVPWIGGTAFAIIGLGFSIATNRDVARTLGDVTVAGIRGTMLGGEPITARRFVAEVRRRLRGREIHVYDRRGFEVFAPLRPPHRPQSLPAPLRAALAGDASRSGNVALVPVPHEDRCRRCHEAAPVRGVLSLGPRPEGERVPTASDVDIEARLVALAFTQLMGAKRTGELTPFFDELAESTGHRVDVAVLDTAGEVAFGALPLTGLPEHEVVVPAAWLDALGRGDLAIRPFEDEGLAGRFIPLANEERCHACHGREAGPMRGALVVSVRTLPGPDLVAPTVDRALRWLMLSGLAGLVGEYLDRARTAAGLDSLALHDALGRPAHDAGATARPPAPVRRVLGGGEEGMGYVGRGAARRFLAVRKVANRPECFGCHGADHAIRGVVLIVGATDRETKTIRAQIRTGALLGAANIALVLAFLRVARRWIAVD